MKRLIISLAAIAALTSCIYEDDQTHAELVDVTISAGIDTKTVMSGESVMWESGDKVSLVFKSSSDAFVGEFTADIDNGTSAKATFLGGVATDVTGDNGYADAGLAVYPSTAVDAQTGEVSFVLPSEQYAKADGSGSFDQHLNLSSSVVSLADIKKDQHADANFRNALSVLRFNLSSDVESVVISTDKPLTGKPKALQISSETGSEGRLLMDGSVWEEPSASVTLYPEEGNETFKDNVTYSVLIWPGTHSSLTVRVNFKDYSSYEKTLTQNIVFAPSKYYSLTLAGKDLIVSNITGRLDNVDGSLAEIKGRLDKIEGTQSSVDDILSQIQSVSLMSEYLDNSVYASYAKYTNSLVKLDIELDFLIRPASAAKALVDAIDAGPVTVSDVFKGLLYYRNSEGSIDFETAATELTVKGVSLVEDVLTVSIEADGLSDGFYSGGTAAELALEISSASAKTYLVSDFAKLVPMSASGIKGNYIENIPVPKGVEVSIPFSYTAAADEYEITASGTNTSGQSVTYNTDYNNGFLRVGISNSDVASQSATLTITSGETVLATQVFTFAEAGVLEITTDGPADYIGGDVVVTVGQNDFAAGTLTKHNDNGTGVAHNGMVFSFGENTGQNTRSATALYAIKNGSLTYNKYIDIEQYGTSTSLKRTYYADGAKIMLNEKTASTSYPLNIVIFGDGYKQKDLSEGGKFERTARSATDVFFSIEPFKSFKDRFNVYMVPYASADEGLDIREAGSENVDKNTYFDANMKVPGNTWVSCNTTLVADIVKNHVGLDGMNFYRTIAIVLVNTDEGVGSTVYTESGTNGGIGGGYISFAVAVLAANSQATNGLIKHEAGGHAFGRLADEYYNGGAAPSNVATLLDAQHAKGFYLNICTDTSYWQAFKDAGYKDDEVSYIDGAWTYSSGVYRPTLGGIMQNNNGVFNAPSRRAIYERIMVQSGWTNAYNWNLFLEWDKKNR